MEQIIFGLLSSPTFDQNAKKFFKHIKKKPNEIFQSMNVNQKKFLWVTCLHFYSSENEDKRAAARSLHKLFLTTCWQSFGYVLSLDDIQYILTSGNMNKLYEQVEWPLEQSSDDFVISFVILFLDFLSDIFQNIPKTVEVINIHDGCANAVKGFCVKIVYLCQSAEECAKVCNFFTMNMNCVDDAKYQAICNILMGKVGGFLLHHIKGSEIKKLRQNVIDIMKFIKVAWTLDEKTFFSTIQKVFGILATQNGQAPSVALGGITEIVPTATLSALFETILQNSSVDNKMLARVFTGIVNWLLWPTDTSNTKIWILNFLVCLKRAKNFSCLVDVIYCNTTTVFKYIKFPKIRVNCTEILEVMLLAYQHSPDAFHSIVPMIPNTIKHIKEEKLTTSNEECLMKLNKLIQCLMFKFSGFPKEYEEIWDILKDLDFPIIEEICIAKCLENSSWITPALPAMKSEMYYHTDLSSRSTVTNKAGLVNLGNTCFANSVIQVLYHAKGFVKLILKQTEQCSSDSIHAALLETFAFLENTSREAYEPKQLMVVTKPPWFVSGMQQDCSEYVKFLIDKLELEESQMFSSSSSFMHYEPKIPKIMERELSIDDASDSQTSTASVVPVSQTQCVTDITAPVICSSTLTMESLFTGQMSVKTKCHKCQSISSRQEKFVDISLSLYTDSASGGKEMGGLKGGALPHLDLATTSTAPVPSNVLQKSTHKFDDLVDGYFKDEILDEDNKYHCNTCDSLQTATKSLELEELPCYLFFTVMRFTYDKVLQRRTKILDSVEIKPFIFLPINQGKPSVGYKLCGVIIHSGSSADSGHYYSYSCSTDKQFFESTEKPKDQWYLFNDSTTSLSNLENMQRSCERFERDTVYMLLYAKLDQKAHNCKFNDTLINRVLLDNAKFEKEKEKHNQRLYEQSSAVENLSNLPDNDEDDDESNNSLKPCGGQMDLGAGRMIF